MKPRVRSDFDRTWRADRRASWSCAEGCCDDAESMWFPGDRDGWLAALEWAMGATP